MGRAVVLYLSRCQLGDSAAHPGEGTSPGAGWRGPGPRLSVVLPAPRSLLSLTTAPGWRELPRGRGEDSWETVLGTLRPQPPSQTQTGHRVHWQSQPPLPARPTPGKAREGQATCQPPPPSALQRLSRSKRPPAARVGRAPATHTTHCRNVFALESCGPDGDTRRNPNTVGRRRGLPGAQACVSHGTPRETGNPDPRLEAPARCRGQLSLTS